MSDMRLRQGEVCVCVYVCMCVCVCVDVLCLSMTIHAFHRMSVCTMALIIHVQPMSKRSCRGLCAIYSAY